MIKIGFIGGGQIASALAGGFLAGGFEGGVQLGVVDRFPASAARFAERFGAKVFVGVAEMARECDMVFLCVKPGDVAGALAQEQREVLAGKLLVSVVAGLPLARLVELAGEGCRVCRSMPNTAAEVRLSATAACFSPNCTEDDKRLVMSAFGAVGEAMELPEKFFDAVVGVSGSGPAYACLLIEAMSDGAVAAGLPRDAATRLAALAVRGAAALVLETGRHPAELREKISSPAGTTIAALAELEAGAVRYHVSAAVQAAAGRSAELSSQK